MVEVLTAQMAQRLLVMELVRRVVTTAAAVAAVHMLYVVAMALAVLFVSSGVLAALVAHHPSLQQTLALNI